MNQLEFGFHSLRTGFMAATLLFLCYVAWRRTLFVDAVLSARGWPLPLRRCLHERPGLVSSRPSAP